MVAGHQGIVVQFGAEIARMNVGDDLACVASGGKIFPDESVEGTVAYCSAGGS